MSWDPDPPQGFSSEQQLVVIRRGSSIPLFSPPQRIFRGGPTITKLIQVLLDTPPIADSTFDHYKFYTIDTGQVPVGQTNMALVLIDSLPAGTFIGTSGFDLRVFDSAGVPIPYEVELANINANGSGDIIVWFDMPVVDVGEFIQVTYGKAGATDGQNPSGVYDVNYKAVYHLDGTGIDSTSNAQSGTVFGATLTTGKIGNALNFTGTVNDYVIRNPFTGFPTTDLTISGWFKTTGAGDGMVSYAVIGTAREFLTFDQQFMILFVNGALSFSSDVFNDGTFHFITVTWRSSDGQLLVYDGSTNTSSATHQMGATLTTGGAVVLAQDQGNVGGGFNGGRAYNGVMDNVMIEDIVRDQNYVTARFNNQNDNNAFWSESALLANLPSLLVDAPDGEPIQVVELVA